MDLVGAWVRQLLRAGTAAAIVPLALLAALLVVALGSGGLGGLGSLDQLVKGPTVPRMDVAGRSPTENVGAAPVASGRSDTAPRRATPQRTRGAGGTGARALVPTARAPQRGPVRQIVPGGRESSVIIGPSRPSTLAPVPTPPGSAGPKGPPQLGEVLGETVKTVVVGVPTFLGQVVQGLVQALGLTPPPR